jgi:WD40 repeat protein
MGGTPSISVRPSVYGHIAVPFEVVVAIDKNIVIVRVQDDPEFTLLMGHTGTIGCLDYSPDGGLIVSGSMDHRVGLWSTTDRSLVRFSEPVGRNVRCVAFSPDGLTIVSGSDGGIVHVWDTNLTLVNSVEIGYVVESIGFFPDGERVYVNLAGERVRVYNVLTWEIIDTINVYAAGASKIAVSPDGTSIIGISGRNDPRSMNVTTKVNTQMGGYNWGLLLGVHWVPDAVIIVSRELVSRYEIPNNGKIKRYQWAKTNLTAVSAMSSDGNTIALCDDKDTLMVNSFLTGKQIMRVEFKTRCTAIAFKQDRVILM